MSTKGRVTIPTDMDIVNDTIRLSEKWGADAVRDCDGTDFPTELKDVGLKVYSTYYTTRKDNAWAKANPDEIQQMYLMTPISTAAPERWFLSQTGAGKNPRTKSSSKASRSMIIRSASWLISCGIRCICTMRSSMTGKMWNTRSPLT